MQNLNSIIEEKLSNSKDPKEFLALTRQLIKIKEVEINREKYDEMKKRIERLEKTIQLIDNKMWDYRRG